MTQLLAIRLRRFCISVDGEVDGVVCASEEIPRGNQERRGRFTGDIGSAWRRLWSPMEGGFQSFARGMLERMPMWLVSSKEGWIFTNLKERGTTCLGLCGCSGCWEMSTVSR